MIEIVTVNGKEIETTEKAVEIEIEKDLNLKIILQKNTIKEISEEVEKNDSKNQQQNLPIQS
jgi:hypothetical protein